MSLTPLQLTLAIIKPHVLKNPVALKGVRQTIIANNFKVVKTKRLIISQKIAEKFYEEHKNKFFYNRLVTFMCSGPSDVHILALEDAIATWRRVMGPTKVYRAQYLEPHSIRGAFGLSDTRNASHGSDSPESAAAEIAVFFPEFSIQNWFAQEEQFFREGHIVLSENEFVHVVDSKYQTTEIIQTQ